MFCAERIYVHVAHANPLVAAGLEAAFRAREDFQLVEPVGTDISPQSAAVSVAVTDCEAGMRLVASKQCSTRRLLILTDDTSEITIRRAVGLGIQGYLPLSSCVEAVVRAVRSIHCGGTAIAPIVMAKMAISLRSQPLTGRELEVLSLLMQGLPDKAIARRLERSVGTAKSHVKAILTKLEASSRTQAIAVALRRGLVQDESIAV
jgi:DNA-binding NarL/FixJ family response regulator